MSLISDFLSWAGRLFGRRPDPTQALRDELARNPPSGKGPQKSAAPGLKTEATPYPRAVAGAPAAPPTAASGEAPPAPTLPPPAERRAPPTPPPAEPDRKTAEKPELSPSALPAAAREAARAAAAAPLAIPEPSAGAAPLADPAAARAAEPAPPPILPPISLLAPPKPERAEGPAAPSAASAGVEARAFEAAPPKAPAPEHSSVVNPSLSEGAQPEPMKAALDLAPASAPPPPALFDEEQEEEDLVDLSLVDEDMQALDARALGRARPLLAAPPLDMLVARWRKALARMQGPEAVWALFKHGTVVLFAAAPRNAEGEARELLKAQNAGRSGASEPEVTALPNGAGWLVGGLDPRLFTYVAPEEASATTPLHVIGRLGRAKREEDGRDLEITHIENDPFWRPPED